MRVTELVVPWDYISPTVCVSQVMAQMTDRSNFSTASRPPAVGGDQNTLDAKGSLRIVGLPISIAARKEE